MPTYTQRLINQSDLNNAIDGVNVALVKTFGIQQKGGGEGVFEKQIDLSEYPHIFITFQIIYPQMTKSKSNLTLLASRSTI